MRERRPAGDRRAARGGLAVSGGERLQELTARLDAAAERLRGGELEPEQAAREVEQCARLAGDLVAELERAARATAGGQDQPPAQRELLSDQDELL